MLQANLGQPIERTNLTNCCTEESRSNDEATQMMGRHTVARLNNCRIPLEPRIFRYNVGNPIRAYLTQLVVLRMRFAQWTQLSMNPVFGPRRTIIAIRKPLSPLSLPLTIPAFPLIPPTSRPQ